MSRLESSAVLKDLKPETEYVVNVYSVVEDEYSEPLKGTEKTCKSDLKTNLIIVLFFKLKR